MSNIARVAGQAANTLSKPLDITDVFSTYLYTANSSTLIANNGIDLDGEGGLVWIKNRNNSRRHALYDTERGVTKQLSSNLTDAERTMGANATITFNSDGFSIPAGDADVNGNTGWGDYASWTFRKAPKFFDVVTFNNDGNAQTISHNLGSVPGMIIMKRTDAANNWAVYHRSSGGPDKYLYLNTTASVESNTRFWDDTDPTSTEFTIGNINQAGTYVAYLFAHNDGDGAFGPDGDADVIKCGSYTGNDGTQDINLGFEPAWVLVKSSSNARDWKIIDNMRGFAAAPNNKWLTPNSSNSEETINASASTIEPTATGFRLTTGDAETNAAGWNYIYMAIRRGPLAVPEDATEVFNVLKETTATLNQSYLQQTTFPVDFVINKAFGGASSWWSAPRLTNARLQLESTSAETAAATTHKFDQNDGVIVTGLSGSSNFSGYHFRRAPGFFDAVAYTGNGTAGRTISHNLGVAPEMMWVKRRDSAVNWAVYAAPLGATKRAWLNLTNAFNTDSTYWNDTEPTSTEFTVGTYTGVNTSGGEYIAYLFSSLAGVSKVGSYTGNGGSQTIDCGFTSGARFVLIRSTAVGNWYVFDTERGIVVGNDPYLSLNTTNAEQTGYDHLTPDSSGFTVTSSDFNNNGANYIFYAIA